MKELLDCPEIPRDHLNRNLRELHTINKYLGGYAISSSALNKVLPGKSPAVILDIGCGGGDMLKEIRAWSIKKKKSVLLNGIDILPGCIDYSRRNAKDLADIRFICDDYRNCATHLERIDVMHASLFCHHLSKAEIIGLIRFALDKKIRLVINDLERNPVAYYSIKALTAIFSRSYLVKNDAPLSVLRGFKRKEWEEMIAESGAKKFSIKNRWAFRHEVIVYE